jgi:predicted SAM-dependent methyltransferase
MSETAKCRERLKKYIEGSGIDIGYGGDPIVDWAITIDLAEPYIHVGDHALNLAGDARNLQWFRDEVLDFVYSSHLLEDFEDTIGVLHEWLRVLKIGGHLILFCPVEQAYREHCKKTNQPRNRAHKIDNFDLYYVKNILDQIGVTETIRSNPIIDTYSFEIVAKKVRSMTDKKSRLRYSKAEYDTLLRHLNEKEAAIKFLKDQKKALLDSNSWKITAPLRKIASMLKKNQ